MKKQQGGLSKYAVPAAILVVIILLGLWTASYYNLLVTKQLDVENKWADIEAQYQRRVDLIPNLVSTVSAYGQFEKSTLTQLTTLRTQWQQSSTVEQKVATGSQIDSLLSRLLIVYENYPDLKTVGPVNNLMVQLEGTENRIAVSRRDYNEAVRNYNGAVRTFPGSLFASIFGFEQKPFFQAQEGAQNAPEVNSNFLG
jgi:LemA protein